MRARFFKNAQLNQWELIVLFTVKVIAALAYAKYFAQPAQINGSDTWRYFNESLIETDKLLHQPKLFFSEIFSNHYHNNNGLFIGTNSIWNDLKTTFFVKLLAIINLFSFKNYYINILFFNLGFMVGCVAFYRLIQEHFVINKWLLILAIFLMPGFLFWGSGIHKDGIVFSCVAIALFYFSKLIRDGITVKRVCIMVFSFAILFILRNYVLLALLPALFCWFTATKFSLKPSLVFASVTALCLLIFLLSNATTATAGLANSIVQKHNEFLLLEGNTKIITPALNESPQSLISYFPFAMQTALLRPFPREIKGIATLIAIAENYFILLFAVVALFKINKQYINSPVVLTCFMISFFLLLFIGYTVCFSGAIVRYRSAIIPLIIVPLLLIVFAKPIAKNAIH